MILHDENLSARDGSPLAREFPSRFSLATFHPNALRHVSRSADTDHLAACAWRRRLFIFSRRPRRGFNPGDAHGLTSRRSLGSHHSKSNPNDADHTR
jgi:hypothetical protein